MSALEGGERVINMLQAAGINAQANLFDPLAVALVKGMVKQRLGQATTAPGTAPIVAAAPVTSAPIKATAPVAAAPMTRTQICGIAVVRGRIVVRDGQLVAEDEADNVDARWVVEKMVGRKVSQLYPDRAQPSGEDLVLEVDEISRAPEVKPTTLRVRAGEVLGIGGLVGAGRTELLRLVYGLDKPDTGEVIEYHHDGKIDAPSGTAMLLCGTAVSAIGPASSGAAPDDCVVTDVGTVNDKNDPLKRGECGPGASARPYCREPPRAELILHGRWLVRK